MDTQPDPDVQVAGYRIEALVGRGGMGEVYRAVQLDLGRRVALKVLAPELAADEAFRRRFLRESRIAASIDHPNIVPIYQAGEHDGLLYIAMRWVEGTDLARLLHREGRLDPPRALAILAQVAGALDAAHARGLVHRDVKPANILLAAAAPDADPHCYLCDFGLIKQTDAAQAFSALTAVDQFVGTVPYVAPEQIEGRPIDGRTDVYSLGCVLFECLTGSVPYPGPTDVEVVFAHLRGSPPPMSTRTPGLPPSLDAVVARALAKSREDRYPTCSALVAALATQLGPEIRGLGPAAAGSLGPAAAGSLGPAAAASQGAAAAAPQGPADDDETRSMVLPPAPAPPLAGPAPRPASPDPPPARPDPGRGEPRRPTHGGPAPAAGRGHPGSSRRRGRRWLAVLVAVAVPVAVYVAATQLFSGAQPEVGAAPDQAGVVTGPPATARPARTAATACPGGWTNPAVGTPSRSAPLDAIRAQMGWTDRFVVEEMRLFTGGDGLRRWYVKAHQESSPSLRGRWLVEQGQDGQRRVVASASFTTKGYEARDWRVTGGQGALPAGLAACLANT